MTHPFNFEEAKQFLEKKSALEREKLEHQRQTLLKNVVGFINKIFKNTEVEAYIIGSAIQAGRFTQNSDVDIVLKNFKGDRFDLWAQLEKQIGWKVEIILYEHCPFQNFVISQGLKIL